MELLNEARKGQRVRFPEDEDKIEQKTVGKTHYIYDHALNFNLKESKGFRILIYLRQVTRGSSGHLTLTSWILTQSMLSNNWTPICSVEYLWLKTVILRLWEPTAAASTSHLPIFSIKHCRCHHHQQILLALSRYCV